MFFSIAFYWILQKSICLCVKKETAGVTVSVICISGNADLFINQRGGMGRSPANPTSGNPAKPDFRFDQCFPYIRERTNLRLLPCYYSYLMLKGSYLFTAALLNVIPKDSAHSSAMLSKSSLNISVSMFVLWSPSK